MWRAGRRRHAPHKPAEGAENASLRQMRAETEAGALRSSRNRRVPDVRGVEKEREMAGLRAPQVNRGNSRLHMGKARPENGEEAEKATRGAWREL